jgi:riboflavin synthase
MFTGLVEQIGSVVSNNKVDFGIRLSISCDAFDEMPKNGDSIAISGCCLTIVDSERVDNATILRFDVIEETLKCTHLGSLVHGSLVNVELAMRGDSRFGGHFVQGHIDSMAKVIGITKLYTGEERIRFSLDTVDRDVTVSKGSIAIDGVSLTIACIDEDWFEVCLIPTTLQETTLGTVSIGSVVNIETDMLARTVAQVVKNLKS